MARNFVKASTQWLDASSTRSVPLTMAIWLKTTDFTNTNVMMDWRAAGFSGPDEHYMLIRGATTDKLCTDDNVSAGAFGEAAGSVPPSGTWFHSCSVWAASNDRKIYLNGTLSGSDTANVVIGTTVDLSFGRLQAGSNYFDGDQAEPCFWSVALSAGDIATLAKGFNPRRIRPQYLLGAGGQHWRFFSGGGFNSPMGSVLTNHGTTGSQHPRIYA